uniref:Uncharacterized protein n=1 Tax=Romanomermis culicivorax TaxID=13658 RepID=A0A915KCZ1_ROMCU
MSYCLSAQRTLADPDYYNDLLSFADIRRLNAMYCWPLRPDCGQALTNAPVGRRMAFKFVKQNFFMYCRNTYMCQDYVEVRASKDLSVNGY